MLNSNSVLCQTHSTSSNEFDDENAREATNAAYYNVNKSPSPPDKTPGTKHLGHQAAINDNSRLLVAVTVLSTKPGLIR